LEQRICMEADRLFPELVRISREIHDHPEPGYREEKAATLLMRFLLEHGFRVEPGAGGLKTAFRAVKGTPSTPSVAFLSEYDALPAIGHACGHNLIAAAGVGAGVSLASVLTEDIGRVLVIGTPAEEMHGGKIRMIEAGVFGGIDAAMMFHPSMRNAVVKRTLCLTELQVTFHGRSAHAAAQPEKGINALDAMVLAFSGINALRQQIPEDARIHGIITRGGDAVNVIPERTEARIAVRALEPEEMEGLLERVRDCLRGAALQTGCHVEIQGVGPVYQGLQPNYTLAGIFQKKLEGLGVQVDDTDETRGIGSSDIGNLSRVVPVIHPELSICGTDCLPHTPEFCRKAGSESAERVMGVAVKALALTGLTILLDPDVRAGVKKEFLGSGQYGAERNQQ